MIATFLSGIGILLLCFYFLENIIKIYTKNINKLFLDKPNIRSMHEVPTPTGGGILILITILISYSIWNFISYSKNINDQFLFKILLISTPLSIVSFYDDLKNISQKLRYFIQLLTGLVLIINSNLIEFSSLNSDFFYTFLLIIPILLIFITGFINVTNFMDGIDGLVAGAFSVIFISLTIKFDVSMIFISFILIVFLKWNWQPAYLFMGDAGSTFLGSVFAGILISTQNYLDFISIFLLSMPLIIDSTTCLLWRYFNGYNIFSAHKMHLYQRLVIGGLSHEKVSIFYISSITFISVFYLIGNLFLEFSAVGIVTLLGIYLHFKFASPLYKL